jgi:xylulokinase
LLVAPVVCALDLGSSLIKAALVDEQGTIAAMAKSEAPPVSGDDGAFDADTCWTIACETIRTSLERCDVRGQVQGLAMSTQRSCLVFVGPHGRAVGPAFSWQGTACGAHASAFYDTFGADRFRAITGLLPSPIYTAAKLAHLRRTDPDRLSAASRMVLLHDYVLRHLGADDFYTDPSNASASGLMDLDTRCWCDEILSALDVPRDRLGLCVDASTRVGGLDATSARATGLPEGLPLFVGGGDQPCAALGSGAIASGSCVMSLGTAAAVLCPVTASRTEACPSDGLLRSAHVVPGQWVVEGFQPASGAALQWVGNLIGTRSLQELENLALDGRAEGLLFLPFLSGIGSPDFDGSTKAALLGATLSHRRPDLARAAIEGVCMELRRILETFSRVAPLQRLLVAGGACEGALLMSLLADVLGRPFDLVGQPEAALLGAAAIAWTGVGRFRSIESAAASVRPPVRSTVRPRGGTGIEQRYARYVAAVDAIRALSHAPVGARVLENRS